MSSDPTESFLVLPCPGREVLYVGIPYINPALPCAPTADSSLEATVRDKQGRTTFYHSDEASLLVPSAHFRHSCVQLGPQPHLPNYEVSAARFPMVLGHGSESKLGLTNVPQARPHEAGGHVTTHASQDRDGGSRNMNHRAARAWAVCTDCNRRFGLAQELARRRHRRDVHEQPRYCPFCDFKWTRPNNIKTHLLTRHRGKVTAELLVTIRALRASGKTSRDNRR
jgi:hypothetical protein